MLQAVGCDFIKKNSDTGVFLEFSHTFINALFYKTVAASVKITIAMNEVIIT